MTRKTIVRRRRSSMLETYKALLKKVDDEIMDSVIKKDMDYDPESMLAVLQMRVLLKELIAKENHD